MESVTRRTLESVSPTLRKLTYYNPFVIAEKLLREIFVFKASIADIWVDFTFLIVYAIILFLLIMLLESLLHQQLIHRYLYHSRKHKKKKEEKKK